MDGRIERWTDGWIYYPWDLGEGEFEFEIDIDITYAVFCTHYIKKAENGEDKG